jgi:hypothetical protein
MVVSDTPIDWCAQRLAYGDRSMRLGKHGRQLAGTYLKREVLHLRVNVARLTLASWATAWRANVFAYHG